MLSPKIQRSIRVNDGQLIALSERAQYDHSQAGYLHKRSSDNTKWQLRWFVLYQNLLFYYESENNTRPTGVLLLEGSYCERLTKAPMERNAMFCFTISYRRESQRQYELRAASEVDCSHWVDAIREASFNKLLLQKEELEQKQLHLLQVVESERTSRWQYAQQCDELSSEVKKLRTELCAYKKEHEPATRTASTTSLSPTESDEIDPAELRKIKKVQSFFRGWLCRRRWKQIVEQYIKSPHAESMRKRNSLVFKMVEAEEEYLEQMECLVTCFLRPFKMAASSKKPPCTHEDVNSIFLNSETVLFLHQIFFKGLTSRMESWPTLVLGDLFDMLLPMLTIYQEYVRNHHYSLQVLTECKQNQPFTQLLARLESKPACQSRLLEAFLTYPMHQIPRYIITLHELLAHTPHDHVERRSLQHARAQLEELSRQMHDEVSETENLRKNLAVERMIIEGCDILLDVNQVFIRQGTVSQVVGKGRRASLQARQAFLFSNHLLLTTRAAGGRLHLPPSGRLPLYDALLIEDPSNHDDDDSTSVCSSPGGDPYHGKDFKILVEVKGEQICAHLVSATLEDKAAWTSELAQCMESAALTELLRACGSCGAASASLPACRSDRALFTDDVDIRFSRTLNSCKVPQIRSATPERLLQRLTDLRFLSVDFLNTFLLTYRVFTDGVKVLEALKAVFYEQSQQELELAPPDAARKASGASSVSGYGSEYSDRDWQSRFWRASRKSEEDDKLSPYLMAPSRRPSAVKAEEDSSHLQIPKIMATSSSNETLKGTSPSSPGALSSVTLVGSPKKTSPVEAAKTDKKSPTKDNDNAAAIMKVESIELVDQSDEDIKYKEEEPEKNKHKIDDKFKISQRFSEVCNRVRTMSESPRRLQPGGAGGAGLPTGAALADARRRSEGAREVTETEPRRASDIAARALPRRSVSERRCTNSSMNSERRRYWGGSEPRTSVTSQVSQMQNYRRETSQPKAGVVITSFRQSHRRSSTSTAAAAFAVATSASSNPRSPPPTSPPQNRRDSVISTAATMRVLNVLRHWVSKHSSDFWSDERLRGMTMDFLKEIEGSPGLLPAEHKAAAQLLRLLERAPDRAVDLKALFAPPRVPTKESIETLSALEIAEQMTYLDYQIFSAIHSEEFLGQAWTKADKAERAPHILMMTGHFNHISNLVISEILKKYTLTGRVSAIEKWAAVADIMRCLHNFNGVLQVCAALSNTAVYRLKKTWDKVSKTTKQTIEKMQTIISSECRFRILRESLHRCDPPCIPYLGMYLSDLSFIEEGTSNYTPDGLLNFSKMRMIAHVIREIRNFQQTPYKIDHIPKVCDYLLEESFIIPEERQFTLSLEIEPRAPRGSAGGLAAAAPEPASPAAQRRRRASLAALAPLAPLRHDRSSTSTAAAAFAVATSASSNPRSPPPTSPPQNRRDSVISTAATMRVLNVLRHWVSKHSSDFWSDERLRGMTMDFLKEIEGSPGLLPAEHKAAAQLLRLLERAPDRAVDLKALFAPPRVPTKESIETLSALEIAEQMTYLDYQIFSAIHSEEFLGQAWTKADKAERAPHILMMTGHFNHISNLVISEILKKYTLTGRVSAIEKWAAVADIMRCLHNFNGVLQVCAALSNTAVYRLKKTWDKVSKTTKQTIEKMQTIISSECRFRILRESLHRCDPPCIPYLGMYLSDLSFIEEGTSNYTPDGLLNFSKMRMIAHVIREIRNFQQTPYKIDHIPKVCDYLLEESFIIPEERQFTLSLEIEPRAPRGSAGGLAAAAPEPASPAAQRRRRASLAALAPLAPLRHDR